MNIMTYFSLTGLLNGLSCLALGLFVYFNNRQKLINKTYLYFAICIAIWSFGYFFWPLAKTKTEALNSFRLLHLGAVFVAVCCYHFICALTDRVKENKKGIIIGYLLSTFFAISISTRLYIQDMVPKFIFKFWAVPGILYHFYLLFFFSYLLSAIYILFKEYKNSKEAKRKQYLYVLIATVLGALGGSTNYPLWYNIPIYPIANITMTLYAGIIAYAIIRHQLMDIEVMVKKTLVFAGLLASVFLMLILPTLIIQEYLFRGAGIGGRLIGLTISGIIIIFTMRKIESFLINITDKYLFQKKYDYKELLKTFTEEVLTVLDLGQLIALTKDKLTEIIKMESCDVALFDDEKEKPIITAKGERIIPLTLNNRNIGVLKLGKKKSDEGYTQDDMDILLPLARTLAIAISNAQLFDELGKAQVEAAQREKMATIGTLAAGMAHEIRNPITTIRTFADYLPERFKDTDFINRFQKLIPKEIGKIETIAQSLLELSYAGEGSESKENFDIYDSIKAICSLLEMQYRYSGFHISYDINGSAMIFANKNQIHEAFFNIITYIFAETSKGSTVEIEVRKDGENVSVFIRDKGLIISDYIIRDVFEPVSKMTLGRRGFGFRLLISKQIVEKNGGSLAIISDAGKGAEVIIKF